jgi:hypothetical protein
MPYLIGIRNEHLSEVLSQPIEQIVIVHLDRNFIEVTTGKGKKKKCFK